MWPWGSCSASLPCPAEMGASIHINGTGSSIIDTVFVCRSTGIMQKKWLADSPDEVAKIVEEDLNHLRAGNVKPTPGDIRCVTYGHLIRLAIWSLRHGWNKNEPTTSRIAKVSEWIHGFGEWPEVEKYIVYDREPLAKDIPLFAVGESVEGYGAEHADVSF
jgi:putative DNA methylase